MTVLENVMSVVIAAHHPVSPVPSSGEKARGGKKKGS